MTYLKLNLTLLVLNTTTTSRSSTTNTPSTTTTPTTGYSFYSDEEYCQMPKTAYGGCAVGQGHMRTEAL